MIPAAADGSVRLGGLTLRDHVTPVPLDHAQPSGERIAVFAREAVATGREQDTLPWLVYLQGGPGGAADRPDGRSGWIERAVRTHRVLLLDQRGTGRSTPITPERLAGRGGPQQQADYLALHRADSIVRDAEAVRTTLLGADGRWSLLGQSYGGFCSFSYLSIAPEHLDAVHITGGIPPIGVSTADVYRALWPRVAAKNAEYFRAFPGDRERLDHLVDLVRGPGVTLPDGSALTVRRLQMLGMGLGAVNGVSGLHWLLDDVVVGEPASPSLTARIWEELTFAAVPLYALLHEACYAEAEATQWAAQRVRPEFRAFAEDAEHVLLTGEMVAPWLLDEDPSLRPYREVGHLLAERDDWPWLYNPSVLATNSVPVAAAVYADDMCVDANLSLGTAAMTHSARTWVTNEHEHDGLRVSSAVLDRLMKMTAGEV